MIKYMCVNLYARSHDNHIVDIDSRNSSATKHWAQGSAKLSLRDPAQTYICDQHARFYSCTFGKSLGTHSSNSRHGWQCYKPIATRNAQPASDQDSMLLQPASVSLQHRFDLHIQPGYALPPPRQNYNDTQIAPALRLVTISLPEGTP